MSLDLDAMEKAARERAEDCTDDRWEAFLNAFDPPIVLRLIKERREMLDALKRLADPAPGVKRLPPWAVGIARSAIAQTEAP